MAVQTQWAEWPNSAPCLTIYSTSLSTKKHCISPPPPLPTHRRTHTHTYALVSLDLFIWTTYWAASHIVSNGACLIFFQSHGTVNCFVYGQLLLFTVMHSICSYFHNICSRLKMFYKYYHGVVWPPVPVSVAVM